jgi:hypothetical protein
VNLHDFQFKLHQHNLRYNADICNLTQKEKVQHYALKVAGLCSDFYANGTALEDKHGPRLVYAVLSLANFFNVSLIAAYAKLEGKGRRLNTFDANVKRWQNDNVSRDSLFFLYIEEVGKFCKVAEALDHLEPMDFRKELHAIILELFLISMRILRHEDDDDYQNYEEICSDYICSIEDKHHFREHFGSFSSLTDPEGYRPL